MSREPGDAARRRAREARTRRARLRGYALLAALVLVVAGVTLAFIDPGHQKATPTTTARVVTAPTVTHARPPVRPRHETALERLTRLGLPLYCGGSQAPVVALTFDDGPGPYTETILDVLRRHHARASFFLVGNKVPYYPAVPRQELRLGALGSHTWSHADLTKLPPSRVAEELSDVKVELLHVAGAAPRLFRPPYEAHTPEIDRRVQADGMLEVLWSVDSTDYLDRSPAKIADAVVAKARPGSIVLLHDIQPRTPAVLRLLLPALKHRHLRAVSIPELLRVDAPTPARLAGGSRACTHEGA